MNRRKTATAIGGQYAMKQSSEQTRNGFLSAPFDPEDVPKMRSVFRRDPSVSVEVSAEALKAACAPVDPSNAYGCVDWFIYPDPKTTARV